MTVIASDMSASDQHLTPYERAMQALNPAQREAVETIEGAVLVLAGAGTGKTRVLTTRIAHILMTQKIAPNNILAVTFTNKAAREMMHRVGDLIGGVAEGMWIGTFHALCVRILRRHAELVNLKPQFTILDTDDQLRLIKQLIEANGIDDKRWPARMILAVIQRWKDRGLTPDKVSAVDVADFDNDQLLKLYKEYQQRLSDLNAVDFGDLLLHCLTLFQQNADVLKIYQNLFRYILVDEYQDTNVAQYLWLRLLAMGHEQEHQNICCVGDEDQSIYSWRGAQIDNILRFEKDFPGAKTVRLEENYRSTQPILSAASHLIANNDQRLGKTLWTGQEGGDLIQVRQMYDGRDEARFVATEIENLHAKNHALNNIAILVRASFQTRAFEERFLTQNIPYRVIGGPRFYERQEIKDAMAYLRLVHSDADDLAFERIINQPKRGLGKTTQQTIHALAKHMQLSLLEASRRIVETDELRAAARNSLRQFIEAIDRWRGQADSLPHHELMEIIIDESGYSAMWQNDKSPEAPGRLENLKELRRAMEEFPTLDGFLEHVVLVTERAESDDQDMVNLMTLHSAKGLEFETVFLPGWEEGTFPNQRSLDETGATGLEEERRLAYVGITRAKQRLFITHAHTRYIYGEWSTSVPSRFLAELPKDMINEESEVGSGSFMSGGFQQNRQGYFGRSSGHKKKSYEFDTTARKVATVKSDDPYAPGRQVKHNKFGDGVIKSVEGDKLEIIFAKGGLKKVLKGFVDPK